MSKTSKTISSNSKNITPRKLVEDGTKQKTIRQPTVTSSAKKSVSGAEIRVEKTVGRQIVSKKDSGKNPLINSRLKISKPSTKGPTSSQNKNDPNKSKPSLSNSSNVIAKSKPVSKTEVRDRNVTKDKRQPLRAVAIPAVIDQVKKVQNRIVSKSNVMNNVHNVTVLSPPAKRKEVPQNEECSLKTVEDHPPIPLRDRTRTRTLGPDEVLVLKSGSGKVKEPVAFEINFPEDDKKSTKVDDYEDDFESYESDFETGSSTRTSQSTEQEEDVTEEEESSAAVGSSEENSESEEETQLPVTVMHRDDERKLDSGHYDLNSKKESSQDSLDTNAGNSGQFDSGISYLGTDSRKPVEKPKPTKYSKRAMDLMGKLELDTITYTLFESTPMKYELYMRMYGALNSSQATTQTNENRSDTESQTDALDARSMWTQHPPRYDLKCVQEHPKNFGNCCGPDETWTTPSPKTDSIEASLIAINQLMLSRKLHRTHVDKSCDIQQLNNFLNRTIFTLSGVLSRAKPIKKLRSSGLSMSNGFYCINSKLFQDSKVVNISSYPQSSFLLLTHENVKNGKFFSLISIWDVNEPEKPFKILSTWSQVCCTEICPLASHVVVGGCSDGSVAVWDLQDTFSYNRNVSDGYKTVTPTQIAETESAVSHVRSFKPDTNHSCLSMHQTVQFATLSEKGLLTIWGLHEIIPDANPLVIEDSANCTKTDFQSPWSRLKLSQIAVCDLQHYILYNTTRVKKKFKKNHEELENDLFHGTILTESKDSSDDEGVVRRTLQFTDMDTSSDRVFVATNHNTLVSCTKLLKADRFKRIFVETSSLGWIAKIRVLPDENLMAIVLSDGTIQLNRINPPQTKSSDTETSNDSLASESSSSLDGNLRVGAAKSCTIQNIIKNERKTYDDHLKSMILDRQLCTAQETSQTSMKLETNSTDVQVLLPGIVFNKSPKILNHYLELTQDNTKLITLTNGNVRLYDFSSNKEIETSANDHIKQLQLAKGKTGSQNFVALTDDGEVQVHMLK